MADRIGAFDWSKTPIGPMEQWPQSLRTAVSICLGSRFPMMLWWGPQLINIYNDAFISVLGGWHPRALGMSGRDVWTDTWPVIGPQVAHVMEKGGSTLNERVRLVYTRHGFPEETWFTWSFGPIYDESGRVGGLFNTCHEDTQQVLAERERDRLAAHRQLALDAARLGWWHYDPVTKVSTFDKRYTEIFGVTGYQRPNEEILKRLHPDDLPGVWAQVEAALDPTDPKTLAVEYRILLDDGSIRWVEAHGTATFEGEGVAKRAVSFVGTVADVTERRLADTATRDAEQRYRAVFESSRDGKIIYTADGTVVDANPAACAMYGYAHDEIIGVHAPSVIHPDALPAFREFQRVAGSGREFHCETVDRRRNGAAFPIEVVGTPLTLNGRPHLMSAIRDISERKQAGEALRASEERYRRLIDTAYEGIWTIDAQGRTTYVNRRMADLLGYLPEEMIGRAHTDFMWEQDRPRGDVDMELRRQGTAQVWDQRYRRKDGSELWTVASCSTLHDADGKFVGALGMFTDITDRKRAEAERQALLDGERAARAEAERAGRMKDEFLATLSHELRTPLNAILGWATILRGDGAAGEDDLREGLEAIERNARSQTQIIEDLLDMSRIISGKVRLDVQQVDLAAVARGAVETVKPAADAKGIGVHAVLDPLATPVFGDPNRLQQVFWNLLTNAIKFTPKGGHVQVLLQRVNSHVEVRVTDSGEGIRSEFLPHVFDRFKQADASTTRRHGGLGLGLGIVKQLVELHGGTVTAQSAGIGHGSTFVVALPVTPVQPDPSDEPLRRHPQSSSAASPLYADLCKQLAGLKVLLVDDEADSRAVVQRLLEGCNAVVLASASAADAVERVTSERPDVLVSDIGMPDEDGYSLIRRVRALGPERGGNIPAVALTAYARSEDRTRSILAGFQMHIAKPVEPSELIAMVANLAGRTG